MMARRAFIGGSLALATPAALGGTPAPPARKVSRIGILGLARTSDMVGPQPLGGGSIPAFCADCVSLATCSESTT
jgi:hypothetical protein